jgi:SAM-dependent methyltransferase
MGRCRSESFYYGDSGAIASRLSFHVRRKMFQLFMDVIHPGPEARVLDVGVTNDEAHDESNYFERMYPFPHQITCVGTEDGSHLAVRYPGLIYQRVRAGDPLPFRDAEFDVVFSNAVLEHVGSRAAQATFVRELCRVGRSFFITTPNRWFPFEHHTGLPLVHYLPAGIFRALLRHTRYHRWAAESELNILTAREVAGLFPAEATAEVRSIRLVGVPSNLVAFGRVGR